ncbi:unnamed protein product [Moneuplotes crassus]|uniref:Uncharacterized protein n=1 Tax=Euplotes crassus TaxID=5936 RepID=A0AAD1YAK3_EUPCR|nr:unnamed protein product [Moneuplotes crassus]
MSFYFSLYSYFPLLRCSLDTTKITERSCINSDKESQSVLNPSFRQSNSQKCSSEANPRIQRARLSPTREFRNSSAGIVTIETSDADFIMKEIKNSLFLNSKMLHAAFLAEGSSIGREQKKEC